MKKPKGSNVSVAQRSMPATCNGYVLCGVRKYAEDHQDIVMVTTDRYAKNPVVKCNACIREKRRMSDMKNFMVLGIHKQQARPLKEANVVMRWIEPYLEAAMDNAEVHSALADLHKAVGNIYAKKLEMHYKNFK